MKDDQFIGAVDLVRHDLDEVAVLVMPEVRQLSWLRTRLEVNISEEAEPDGILKWTPC